MVLRGKRILFSIGMTVPRFTSEVTTISALVHRLHAGHGCRTRGTRCFNPQLVYLNKDETRRLVIHSFNVKQSSLFLDFKFCLAFSFTCESFVQLFQNFHQCIWVVKCTIFGSFNEKNNKTYKNNISKYYYIYATIFFSKICVSTVYTIYAFLVL